MSFRFTDHLARQPSANDANGSGRGLLRRPQQYVDNLRLYQVSELSSTSAIQQYKHPYSIAPGWLLPCTSCVTSDLPFFEAAGEFNGSIQSSRAPEPIASRRTESLMKKSCGKAHEVEDKGLEHSIHGETQSTIPYFFPFESPDTEQHAKLALHAGLSYSSLNFNPSSVVEPRFTQNYPLPQTERSVTQFHVLSTSPLTYHSTPDSLDENPNENKRARSTGHIEAPGGHHTYPPSSSRETASLNIPILKNPRQTQCPKAGCGRFVRDLESHLMTHASSRPQKCPIPTCKYHRKGFSRKYDRNRHVLQHYEGEMTCQFCPVGTAGRSFRRVDEFKRHLLRSHLQYVHRRSPEE